MLYVESKNKSSESDFDQNVNKGFVEIRGHSSRVFLRFVNLSKSPTVRFEQTRMSGLLNEFKFIPP